MKSLATVVAILFAGAAAATATKTPAVDGVSYLKDGKMTYDVFEVSVDHVDLETCPAGFDPDVVFCRMTLASEQANIFIFQHEGDQALVGVKHVPLDEGVLNFN